MKNIMLNNGVEMPVIGLSVFQIPDHGECERIVLDALQTGYRLIDTAASYRNELAVGKAIKKSGIKRDNLFITTKLCTQDTGYSNTKKAFEKSLHNLQTDYLDLYLIHHPYGDIQGSWKAMEELYKEDRIRAIGVSNFPTERVVDIVDHNKIIPVLNQIETDPFCQQTEIAKMMRENNLKLQAVTHFIDHKSQLFESDLLNFIAITYNKSITQVILRWLLQRGFIVIPKSVQKEKIVENFNIFDFELKPEDMEAIEMLDTKTKQSFAIR